MSFEYFFKSLKVINCFVQKLFKCEIVANFIIFLYHFKFLASNTIL